MKPESDAVTDDEFVLRLVWHDFYKPSTPLVVRQRAFHPRDNEQTGISVFRSACLNHTTDALRVIAESKQSLYIIVELAVSKLKSCGLTVVPDRNDIVPGHCLLPELNCSSFLADKAIWLPRLDILSALAAERIVYTPDAGQ